MKLSGVPKTEVFGVLFADPKIDAFSSCLPELNDTDVESDLADPKMLAFSCGLLEENENRDNELVFCESFFGDSDFVPEADSFTLNKGALLGVVLPKANKLLVALFWEAIGVNVDDDSTLVLLCGTTGENANLLSLLCELVVVGPLPKLNTFAFAASLPKLNVVAAVELDTAELSAEPNVNLKPSGLRSVELSFDTPKTNEPFSGFVVKAGIPNKNLLSDLAEARDPNEDLLSEAEDPNVDVAPLDGFCSEGFFGVVQETHSSVSLLLTT